MNIAQCLNDTATRLSDEQLKCELDCAHRCALLATRTRREAALLRARCLRLELERRALARARVLAEATVVAEAAS